MYSSEPCSVSLCINSTCICEIILFIVIVCVQLCVDYLIAALSVSSACEAMQAAVTYSQDELRNKAHAYVEGHTRVCLGHPYMLREQWCV